MTKDYTTAELADLYVRDRATWADVMTGLPDAKTALETFSNVIAYLAAEYDVIEEDENFAPSDYYSTEAPYYFVTR